MILKVPSNPYSSMILFLSNLPADFVPLLLKGAVSRAEGGLSSPLPTDPHSHVTRILSTPGWGSGRAAHSPDRGAAGRTPAQHRWMLEEQGRQGRASLQASRSRATRNVIKMKTSHELSGQGTVLHRSQETVARLTFKQRSNKIQGERESDSRG